MFYDVVDPKGSIVNSPRWNRGNILVPIGEPRRGSAIACCSPPAGTYHPADIGSPGFTGGYSQLVLSGQAATLKHSILINFELFDRGNRRNGRFQWYGHLPQMFHGTIRNDTFAIWAAVRPIYSYIYLKTRFKRALTSFKTGFFSFKTGLQSV